MSKPIKPTPTNTSTETQQDQTPQLPLVKINFILMIASAVLIITGFLLMLGGNSSGNEFNPDIFSTRRIVVGPTIAFIGFVAMGFAIIYHPGKKD